jgi:DNA polymerase-3 subunit delta'
VLFKDIPGLDHIKTTLIRSVSTNHVAHAQLFDYAPGGGGLAMALAFATYMNCEQKGSLDACGSCASCTKMSKLIHPDVHFVFPISASKKIEGKSSDAFLSYWRSFLLENPYRSLSEWLEHINPDNKQGNISVEEARGILSKLKVKSYEGEYKIMIIWKPDIMNASASNALLKILEEPPQKTLFLLVSDQSDQLLTTILSRAQRITIPAFSDADVELFLNNYTSDQTLKSQITFLSDGNLSEAFKLVQETVDNKSEWFAEWMRYCYKYDLSNLVRLSETFESMNKENQKTLLAYALRLFRDMLIWSQGAGELLRVSGNELNFVKNFSKTVSFTALEKMVEETNTAYFHIERNVKPKMVFLDLSLTISPYFHVK